MMELTNDKIKELQKQEKEAYEKGNMHEYRLIMDAIWAEKTKLIEQYAKEMKVAMKK